MSEKPDMKRDSSLGQGPANARPDVLDTGHLQADLKARAVSGMVVTVSTQAAKLILQILYVAIMARLLTSADFGLIAMVTSVTAVLTVIRDGGLATATIQRATVSQQEITGMFWVNAALGLFLALLTAAISPAVAWFYKDPQLVHLTLLFSITFVLSGLMVQQEAIIRRQMRFKALGAIEIATQLFGSVVGVGAAWHGMGYWSLAIGILASNAANLILLWLFCGWRPGRPVWPAGLNSMLQFGGHVMGYNLVGALGMNVDKILLGRMFGTEVLGYYSRAQALLVQPFNQILVPLGSVAIPTLSRLHAEPVRFEQALLRMLQVIGFISAFISAFLFAGADWIVGILLGERWSETAIIFRAFAITIFTMPISVVATWALTTAGLGKALSFWGVINNSILIVAIVCGLPWGGIGVAMAFSISGILLRVPLLYYFVGKKTATQTSRIIHVVGPAFAAFALASIYLYGLSRLMGDFSALAGLVVLSVSAALIATLALTSLAWGREVWRTVGVLTSGLPWMQRWRVKHD